jgi:hypothetical protein
MRYPNRPREAARASRRTARKDVAVMWFGLLVRKRGEPEFSLPRRKDHPKMPAPARTDAAVDVREALESFEYELCPRNR